MEDGFINFDVMIIEAGILANCLNSSDAGHALSVKIKQQADAAWADKKADVVVPLNPFESGMLLDGLGKASAQISGDLINRLYTAINDMMTQLGIQPLGSQPSQPSPDDAPVAEGFSTTDDGTDAATASDDASAEPATDNGAEEGQAEPVAEDNDTSDGAL